MPTAGCGVRVFALTWLALAAVPVAHSAALTSVDLAALDKIVDNAPLVVFGSDSGGMTSVHAAATQTFRHLVETKGFRTFVFETPWGVETAMRVFLASNRTAFNDDEAYFLKGYVSSPVLSMMLWAREFNAAHPDSPIRFAGIVPEQPVTDAKGLRNFAARAGGPGASMLESALSACDLAKDKYANDAALITYHNEKREKNRVPAYSEEERTACVNGLDMLSGAVKAGRESFVRNTSAFEVKKAELHLLSMRTYIDTLSEANDKLVEERPPLGSLMHKVALHGDDVRFQIFEALRDVRSDESKTFFWMQNWHAARDSQSMEVLYNDSATRTVSFGTRLAERHGPEVVILGTIVPCEECKEPAGSLEPAFAEKYGGKVAVVPLRDATAIAGLPVAKAGALLAQNQRGLRVSMGNVVLKRHFDGIVYLPSAD